MRQAVFLSLAIPIYHGRLHGGNKLRKAFSLTELTASISKKKKKKLIVYCLIFKVVAYCLGGLHVYSCGIIIVNSRTYEIFLFYRVVTVADVTIPLRRFVM